MPFKPVILWTDALVFVLVVAVIAFGAPNLRRRERNIWPIGFWARHRHRAAIRRAVDSLLTTFRVREDSTACAAIEPDSPDTPPPGWVDAPARNRPSAPGTV